MIEVGTANGRAVRERRADRRGEPLASELGDSGAGVLADFDLAAPRYDLMVALNPGYHRHLRSAAQALVDPLTDAGPRLTDAGPRLLDLGCGSGASTRALLAAASARTTAAATATAPDTAESTVRTSARPTIVAVDASSGMLAQARDKDWPAGVQFFQGLAQDLEERRASWGLDEPLDGVFAAYLLRNLSSAGDPRHQGRSDRDDVLAAVREVLRPGGMFVTQEYSVAGSRSARARWTAVCRTVVMPLSRVTRTDVELYDYLWRSVLRFDSVAQLADRLWRAGFVDVEVRTVPGWQRGILHTFRARVPS